MSEEITLCLRQEDSVQVDQNGVFTSTLATPVELNPGDSVSIKSVFLDTTDVIDIPPGGQEVSLSGMKYLVNYNINQNFDFRAGNSVVTGVSHLQTANAAAAADTGDNAKYWLADALTATDHNPYFLMNVNAFPLTKGRGGKRYGGDVTIQYTDPTDLTKPFARSQTIHIASYQEREFEKHNPIPVPSQARSANPTEFYLIKCASVGGEPQIRVEPGINLSAFNISTISFTRDKEFPAQPITPTGGSIEVNPQIFTWTATVPEGSYTPHEIAAYLNDALTPVELLAPTSENYDKGTAPTPTFDPSQMKWPSNSPFLETVLQNEYTLSLLNDADNTHEPCFINASVTDNSGALRATAGTIARKFRTDAMKADYNNSPFNPPVDRWIGTNQISMSYDENENKLKWDVLHFPIYVNSSVTSGTTNDDAVPGIQYNDLPDPDLGANAPSGLAKAYGGIAFTAMSPQNFWEGQLGFSNNTVVVVPNSATCNVNGAAPPPTDKNCFTVTNCIAGQTITEAAATLDTPVRPSSALQYTGGTPGLFASPVQLGQGSDPSQVSTNDVTAVFANKVYNDSIQSVGYFLIDIDNNFKMDFVSESTRSQLSANTTNGRDTMSIVSRYYTANNFVTDQGEGSIVYTHSGAPKKLTELSVRVKNPDGSFVGDTILGNKNTVFLSINRAGAIKDGGIPEPIAEEMENEMIAPKPKDQKE